MSVIYLDHGATTPIDPAVLEAMLPFFTHHFGNAASAHTSGRTAAAAVERAREQVADLLGAHPLSITFTSGATESINLALKGLAEQSKRRKLITCATEHPAVLDTHAYLESKGFDVVVLPVDAQGRLDAQQLADAVDAETLCVSLMAANNEIGTLHPLRQFSEITHAVGAYFHCDATQAVGKLPLKVDELGVDLLSLSAHKFYGPKGVGALFRRMKKPRVRLTPQLHGGGHERGVRSGTLNSPLIVGLGEACALAQQHMETDVQHAHQCTAHFLDLLQQAGVSWTLNGGRQRLPGNLNLQWHGVRAAALLKACPQLALSSGSACSSANPGASHVLKAIGLNAEQAGASFRLGVGRFTTLDEIETAASLLIDAAQHLQHQDAAAASCEL